MTGNKGFANKAKSGRQAAPDRLKRVKQKLDAGPRPARSDHRKKRRG